MHKTKAIEILSEAKVSFEVRQFKAVAFTAEEVASELNMPLDSVFKTLVLRKSTGAEVMAVVPGTKELNLRKLASLLSEKRVDLVPVSELQKLTGYLKGGVSPLGSKKRMPVYIDSSVEQQTTVAVSAGLRGVQMIVAPADLVRITGAQVADLV